MFYKIFPYFPGVLMNPPAFVTELIGITFYRHVDALLDEVLADEPEAQERVRELLYEIMVDELAHVGQRRNFIGGIGMRISRGLVSPMIRMFYQDIPESKYLFAVDQMVRDGLTFDYSAVPSKLLERTWVPTYCQVS